MTYDDLELTQKVKIKQELLSSSSFHCEKKLARKASNILRDLSLITSYELGITEKRFLEKFFRKIVTACHLYVSFFFFVEQFSVIESLRSNGRLSRILHAQFCPLIFMYFLKMGGVSKKIFPKKGSYARTKD